MRTAPRRFGYCYERFFEGIQLSFFFVLLTNAYPVAYSNLPTFTNWNNGVYSGARTPITVATTKIALNKTINYGVARLDVKAAFKSADGTVPAGKKY